MNFEEKNTPEMRGDALAKLLENYAEVQRKRPKFYFLPDEPLSATASLQDAFTALVTEREALAWYVLASLLTAWFDEEEHILLRAFVSEDLRSRICRMIPTQTVLRYSSHTGVAHQFVVAARPYDGRQEFRLFFISCYDAAVLERCRDVMHTTLLCMGFDLRAVESGRDGEEVTNIMPLEETAVAAL